MTTLCQDGQRLKFLTEKHGEEYAKDFARRTYTIYKKSLLSKKFNHTQVEPYRSRFVRSCVVHKRFYEGKLKF